MLTYTDIQRLALKAKENPSSSKKPQDNLTEGWKLYVLF